MKACTVLGNGPSLRADRVMPDSVPIGVNRSYEVVQAPIWCTADSLAYKRMNTTGNRPPVVFVRSELWNPKVTPVRPGDSWSKPFRWGDAYGDPAVKSSGLVAVRVAMEMNFDRIYLLGFDPYASRRFHESLVPASEGKLRALRRQSGVLQMAARDYPGRFWHYTHMGYKPLTNETWVAAA